MSWNVWNHELSAGSASWYKYIITGNKLETRLAFQHQTPARRYKPVKVQNWLTIKESDQGTREYGKKLLEEYRNMT